MTPRHRKLLGSALRLIICAAMLTWVASQLKWTDVRSAIANADWRWLAGSLITLAPVNFAMALRLQWLLSANNIPISFARSVGVTFAGAFANFVLPGQTGGDVLKAVFIARDTDRRHEAATVVLFDRALGLACIVMLSGAMLLANWHDPALKKWGRPMGIAFAAMIAPAFLYFSLWFRRLIRWDWLLTKLPLGQHLRRIDEAILIYRRHPDVVFRCMLVTWMLQAVAILATLQVGRAIGMAGVSNVYTFKMYYLYVPLCWMAGALPISPQGLGVVEAAYDELLHKVAGFGTSSSAVILSLLIRVEYLVWALPGLAYYLKMGRGRQETVADPGAKDAAP